MNLSSITSIWEELLQSNQPSDLKTSSIDNVDLNSLKSDLITQLNRLLSSQAEKETSLKSFHKNLKKLEPIIPKLNGNEQVFYAKLYRVGNLLSEYYS